MYSQNSESEIIDRYFGDFIGKFLDMGANDGVTLSNTYDLYLRGWRGVCVEASPKAFLRLIENQPNSICIDAAAAEKDGVVVFHESGELLGNGDISLVSTTKQDEMDRWTSLMMKYNTIAVRSLSFKSILRESGVNKFDFLSIDIEGMELEVLPQIDFHELGIKMAVIEWNSKDKEKYDAIMMPFHFKLIHQNAENLIYTIDGNYTI